MCPCLWVFLEVLLLSPQVLPGIPVCLTVDETQHLAAEQQAEEVDGRSSFHSRSYPRSSSEDRRLLHKYLYHDSITTCIIKAMFTWGGAELLPAAPEDTIGEGVGLSRGLQSESDGQWPSMREGEGLRAASGDSM